MLGPVFENPIDKFYFKQMFGDENRYGQIIVNFLSNGIKFTPMNGVASISLRVTEIKDVTPDNIDAKSNQIPLTDSDSSNQSAPDKEIIEEEESK